MGVSWSGGCYDKNCRVLGFVAGIGQEIRAQSANGCVGSKRNGEGNGKRSSMNHGVERCTH